MYISKLLYWFVAWSTQCTCEWKSDVMLNWMCVIRSYLHALFGIRTYICAHAVHCHCHGMYVFACFVLRYAELGNDTVRTLPAGNETKALSSHSFPHSASCLGVTLGRLVNCLNSSQPLPLPPWSLDVYEHWLLCLLVIHLLLHSPIEFPTPPTM